MEPISIAVRTFNERVKAMNQTNARQLLLSSAEARNLHHDIYAMLNAIAESGQIATDSAGTVTVDMDGGSFR